MSISDPIRWHQRHDNFQKVLSQLEAACALHFYSELERAGLVQVFEFTFELGWKTLKDLLYFGGFQANTPREVFRQAFSSEYLTESDTEFLLDALQKRNLLAHTYQEQFALEAVRLIKTSYAPALRNLFDTLRDLRTQE